MTMPGQPFNHNHLILQIRMNELKLVTQVVRYQVNYRSYTISKIEENSATRSF